MLVPLANYQIKYITYLIIKYVRYVIIHFLAGDRYEKLPKRFHKEIFTRLFTFDKK